ncbi:hypothetical protein [Psychromonas aquatilis]|uniref:Uncharacterized protein n=1 Tax=Psychromonas aquatilis TaxID=2005072 RepID=A0ABU9GSS4_9GAMM
MKNKNLIEVVLDNSEVALDQLVESGWVKDIPVVGSAFKLMSASKELKNSMFNAKVSKFIESLEETGVTDRTDFISFFAKNSEESVRVGQSVMLTIDNMNDLEKCSILSRWFAAYILEKISQQEFRRGCDVIAKLFADDLADFINDDYSYPLLELLIGTDLVKVEGGLIDDDVSSIEAVISDFGRTFKVVLNSSLQGS